MTIEKGVPNLTGLFSLQNVTPIHVAPSVWLGLHWKGLRGEAVAAGMLSGEVTAQPWADCNAVQPCRCGLLTLVTVWVALFALALLGPCCGSSPTL